jgi:peptide/nickel transport system ATP-binding protein
VHSGQREKKNEKVWFTQGIQAIFQDPFGTFNPLRTVDSYFLRRLRTISWQEKTGCHPLD